MSTMRSLASASVSCSRVSPATRLAPCRATPVPCAFDRASLCAPSTSGRTRPSSSMPASASRCPPRLVRATAAAVAAAGAASLAPKAEDPGMSTSASSAVHFALNLARVSEVYEVHSWMLLLGILKQERSAASVVLQDLGLKDLYAAWHEVLWALNVSNGLIPRAWKPEITFCPRAFIILRSAGDFATWAGRTRTESQDLLMALAAAGVLDGLFPNVDLGFEAVRAAVERRVDTTYILPGDQDVQSSGGDEELVI